MVIITDNTNTEVSASYSYYNDKLSGTDRYLITIKHSDGNSMSDDRSYFSDHFFLTNDVIVAQKVAQEIGKLYNMGYDGSFWFNHIVHEDGKVTNYRYKFMSTKDKKAYETRLIEEAKVAEEIEAYLKSVNIEPIKIHKEGRGHIYLPGSGYFAAIEEIVIDKL